MIHCFDLVATLLNIYRYRLLEVNHDTKMVYPVRVTSDTLKEKSIKAYSQSEFVQAIAKVLQSPRSKSVVQSLIARSNDTQAQTAT